MQNAERMRQQHLANQFWQTYFDDLLETKIDDQYALEINLLQRLQDTFATQDKDTLRAVALTHIAIPIQSTHMAVQIIRLAKQAINRIQNQE